jgi:hypothetical protein
MSRSRKKPIVKDNSFGNKLYRRIIRRVQKEHVRDLKYYYWNTYSQYPEFYGLVSEQESKIPHAKTIVNDYDRCDYVIDYHHMFYNETSTRLNWWRNKQPLEGNPYVAKAKRK